METPKAQLWYIHETLKQAELVTTGNTQNRVKKALGYTGGLMTVVEFKKYKTILTPEEYKASRKRAVKKATETNGKKKKKYAESSRADNALQHTPTTRESPVTIARNILGKRLQEYTMCDGVAWELDGQPTSLNLVMKEANRILKANKMPQIDVNKAWMV